MPSTAYVALFYGLLALQAADVAHAVGVLAERLVADVGRDLTLVSLARAGVPAGILVKRWIRAERGWDVPHHALSIIRDRGIDAVALARVLEGADSASVVSVDGWTGKGVIADDLTRSLPPRAGLPFPRLAVLADPGRRARWHGSRDDMLIPSACLNASVSGLVSWTMLDERLERERAMHGAKLCPALVRDDLSDVFLSSVTAQMALVRDRVARTVADAPTGEPPEPGWAADAVRRLCDRHGGSDEHTVKPGTGEATRVLLPSPAARGRAVRRGPPDAPPVAPGGRAWGAGRRRGRPPVPRRRPRRHARPAGAVTARPVLVLTDFDGTLIASHRAVEAALTDGAVRLSDLEVVDESDGRPCGYMTNAAVADLEELCDRADVVPVTARSEAQLRRLQLGAVEFGEAVASAGANILVDDRADRRWRAAVEAAAAACAARDVVRDRVATAFARAGRMPPRTDVNDGLVAVVRVEEAADEAVVESVARRAGWTSRFGGASLQSAATGSGQVCRGT